MQSRIIPDIVDEQKLCTLSESHTVHQAAQKMAASDVAAIIVLDAENHLAGILTERDLTRRVLAEGLNGDKTILSEVMTKNPDTLAPNDIAMDALELMQARKYRHLPVVDGDNVVGMVSIRDLYAAVKRTLELDIQETEAFVFGDRYSA
jgi:CBS domain-containing protein